MHVICAIFVIMIWETYALYLKRIELENGQTGLKYIKCIGTDEDDALRKASKALYSDSDMTKCLNHV